MRASDGGRFSLSRGLVGLQLVGLHLRRLGDGQADRLVVVHVHVQGGPAHAHAEYGEVPADHAVDDGWRQIWKVAQSSKAIMHLADDAHRTLKGNARLGEDARGDCR